MLNHAQKIVNSMTEREWGGAYPGNDPRIYGTGLSAMKKSIDTNLELAKIKLQPK